MAKRQTFEELLQPGHLYSHQVVMAVFGFSDAKAFKLFVRRNRIPCFRSRNRWIFLADLVIDRIREMTECPECPEEGGSPGSPSDSKGGRVAGGFNLSSGGRTA